jgi:opacity protein-like surface antigen
MKSRSFALLTGLALLGVAGSAEAQYAGLGIPLSIEARGGVAFPTGDLGEADLNTGFGFQVGGILEVTPRLGVYAGYSRTEFEADDNIVDASFIDSGLNAGVRASFAPVLGLTGAAPYVHGGLVYHQVELDVDGIDEDDLGESDYSLGFEVGGGLDFPLGRKVSVTPAVKYVRYEPEFDGEGSDGDVSYVALDVGLRIRL